MTIKSHLFTYKCKSNSAAFYKNNVVCGMNFLKIFLIGFLYILNPKTKSFSKLKD